MLQAKLVDKARLGILDAEVYASRAVQRPTQPRTGTQGSQGTEFVSLGEGPGTAGGVEAFLPRSCLRQMVPEDAI